MKNLLVIAVIATLISSCTKQAEQRSAPIENIDKLGYEKLQKYYEGVDRNLHSDVAARRSNPYQFYFTCANSWDAAGVAIKGLASEVDIVKFRVGSATMKSYWIAGNAYYINEDGDQIRDWSQFGYFVDKSGAAEPAFFRYRWNDTKHTGGGLASPTIIYSGANAPLKFGMRVRFEFKNIEGSTWWTFSRNGIEVFRADLEITEMKGMHEACTESWGGSDLSPAIMTYYMDRYKDGAWVHLQTGVANQYTWGIQGKLQRPEFIQSQFVMGGNTPLIPTNAVPWLWNKP